MLRGALVAFSPFQLSHARRLRAEGYNAVAFALQPDIDRSASVRNARTAGLRVYGWMQIGRDEQAAARRPSWLCSPKSPIWLHAADHSVDHAIDRDPPAAPGRAPGVVWPWVDLTGSGRLSYERRRIRSALRQSPGLNGLFLADIQGPPVGCGCCRLNCPKRLASLSAHRAGSTAPFGVRLIRTVRRDNPALEIIPVLYCETDQDSDAACAQTACEVACRSNRAEFAEGAVAPVGVLCFYRLFRHNTAEYGPEAGWITQVVRSMRAQAGGGAVIAVLQGWSGSPAQRVVQRERAVEGGASGYLMALSYVRESWAVRRLPARHRRASGGSRRP